MMVDTLNLIHILPKEEHYFLLLICLYHICCMLSIELLKYELITVPSKSACDIGHSSCCSNYVVQ